LDGGEGGPQVARAESDWKREKPVEYLKETYHMGQHNSLKRSHQEKLRMTEEGIRMNI
jgi:hypothetical protein